MNKKKQRMKKWWWSLTWVLLRGRL